MVNQPRSHQCLSEELVESHEKLWRNIYVGNALKKLKCYSTKLPL